MKELLRIAIMGTEQAQQSIPAFSHDVEKLFDKLPPQSPERALLLRAGAFFVYAWAGCLPPAPPKGVDPSPEDTRHCCGKGLSALLGSMMDGHYPLVLPEALELLNKQHKRLPSHMLPRVLLTTSPDLRTKLLPVLGERGRWLAQINPAWNWARKPHEEPRELPENAQNTWEEGTHADRLGLLKLARETDPARGREWVKETWKQEKADRRAELLKLLVVGLSPDDEPFLAQALGDRSSQVREIAARLLWRLPTSELSQKLAARADDMLQCVSPQHALQVKLPREYDKTWERDGILEEPRRKMGKRQWWLAQTLAVVPPSHWLSRFSMSISECLAAVIQHEYAEVLLEGLSAATLRFSVKNWLLPLWNAWQGKDQSTTLVGHARTTLILHMTGEEAEQCACNSVRETKDPSVLLLLPHPWPKTISDVFLEVLTDELKSKTSTPSWMLSLDRYAYAISRGRLSHVLEMDLSHVDGDTQYDRQNRVDLVEEFIKVIQFRRQLREEIIREQSSNQ